MLLKKGFVALVLAFFALGCAMEGNKKSSVGNDYYAKKARERGIAISKPANMSKHPSGPVEFCMVVSGYTVEPAKNGVNEGKGHHHLFIDAFHIDATKPIPKDPNHVHMGDGSKCKTLKLSNGKHTITAVFAKGNHVSYDPPITDTIDIFVG